MTFSPWRIAAVVVLCAALGYRFLLQPAPTPQPAAQESVAQTDENRDAPRQFLKRIQTANSRMATAAGSFSNAIRDALTNEQIEPESLERSHRSTLAVVQTVREEFRSVRPPDSKVARELLAEYRTYLRWQESVYQEDFASLVQRLRIANLSLLERQNMAMTVLHERTGEEQEKNKHLETLRVAFCREHGLKPNP